MAVHVLFVCTGNICRSPLAERLLRARVHVPRRLLSPPRSAGVHARSGAPMDPASAQVLRELGGDPTGHRAAQLVDEDLDADLILTAESLHADFVLRSDPSAMRRTFTLREFARLGESAGQAPVPGSADDLRERIRQIAERRGRVPAPPRGVDDIADPLGVPLAGVRRCGADIDAAIAGVIAALGLPSHALPAAAASIG